MNEERMQIIFNNCLDYLSELWEDDSDEDWNIHWKNIIGLTDNEMRELDLEREAE